MAKKKKSGTSSGKSNKTSMIVAVVVALLVGLYFGGVIVPAFKDSSAPQSRSGSGASVGVQIEDTIKMLETQPDSAPLWTKLGNLYYDTGQHQLSIDAYLKSLTIKADDPHVLIDLGVMYRRNGEPENAIKYFDKAITVSPDHETAYFNKGIVLYYDIKDKPAGIKIWEKLVQLNPAAKTPNGSLVADMIRDLR
ncbi:tetratricopeptide repeat protein [Maridesulfovibrio hydrothermalis]|uniref:TPR repeat-containing protein n=1 Tax=Maridesulfovibrio hydrothermalis AM13 = DSM 14728 TaxID=1121451 RepID=L0R766_9BACT|nr:tetratricopeptide repeat protein [Maridesulfovibrio hydrothermalis]CCO22563.1 TPR repeat-containing protein [Maridesulfovibrio hydrothermalis AM13 = DSM 14728]